MMCDDGNLAAKGKKLSQFGDGGVNSAHIQPREFLRSGASRSRCEAQQSRQRHRPRRRTLPTNANMYASVSLMNQVDSRCSMHVSWHGVLCCV